MLAQSPRFVGRVIRRAISSFLDRDVLTLSAALAFYTLLSFAPLMMMLFWTTSVFSEHVQEALVGDLALLGGADTRIAAQTILNSLREMPEWSSVAGLAGIAIVLVGATSVFAQLQATLNRIWDIEPPRSNAILAWVRRRVISMGVLLAVGFVLIISTVASSAIGMLLSQAATLLEAINEGVTIVIFAILFAALFRYLPDRRLAWRRAFAGGFVAAVLFSLGKWLIGFYLATGHVGRAYGAAGSFVVLLVWTYYSSAVFFFSAELLQAWLTEKSIDIDD
ncbi:MAG TPA: YihY/virulence factor BrkB family protein [Rudaea sp.]|jgi:membrane protein